MRLPLLPLVALLAVLAPLHSARADSGDQRLILVTLDGVRWQDLFRGPDPVLLENSHYTDEDLKESVRHAWFDQPDPAAALMPFLHQMAAKQGVLYGDQDKGECMQVANDMWFSYPGYNEILTGRPDDTITSNDKNYNANVTFLEWLNRKPGFAGSVEAYGTWDVFAHIINDRRSGVPVNARLAGRYPTDTLTARHALEALRTTRPRVLYIGFGDTDELAHVGDYDQYLAAMNRVDDFLDQLWQQVQADPAYRGRTTLIVTTDHGRGERPDETWLEHSSKTYLELYPTYLRDYTATGIEGSGDIWYAALGPGVVRREAAAAAGTCLLQSQIAASALTALGEDWTAFDSGAGAPLPHFGR
jgi:hypothetical protein